MTPEFDYGPVSRGVYIALISSAPIIPLISPEYFFYYILFLIFLGFGLRAFLVKTGLYNLWVNVKAGIQQKWDAGFLDKRARDIDRQGRIEKYRKSRYRDPKLPKNW